MSYDPDYLVPRGVWPAPVLSPEGGLIYYAADRRSRLLPNAWAYVPIGENPEDAVNALWERLDREDPIPEPPQEMPRAG